MYKLYILFFVLLCSCAGSQPNTKYLPNSLNWEYDVDVAMYKANESQKLILLYFYDSNCEWCSKMNTDINNNERIKKLLNDKFILVWIDIEKSELAKTIDIKAVPTVIIVVPTDTGVEPVGKQIGYFDLNDFKKFIDLSLHKANVYKNLKYI